MLPSALPSYLAIIRALASSNAKLGANGRGEKLCALILASAMRDSGNGCVNNMAGGFDV